MILGMVVGLLLKYISSGNQVVVAQPNCTISSATKKLYIRVENGSQYSYTLSGTVETDNSTDQGNELEQMVLLTMTTYFKKELLKCSFRVQYYENQYGNGMSCGYYL